MKDGRVVRKKSFRILAPVSKDYPNRTSVQLLADRILSPLNSGTLVAESSQRLIDFIDNHYLPEAKKALRPSTYKGYKDIVELHLRKRIGDVRVRDFRTVHGQRLMTQIPNVGHKTLLRIRATLSAVFTFALRSGVLDGYNPMHAVSVPGRPKKYRPPSYTLEESAKIASAVYHIDQLLLRYLLPLSLVCVCQKSVGSDGPTSRVTCCGFSVASGVQGWSDQD